MTYLLIVTYVSFIDGSWLGYAIKSIGSNSWHTYHRWLYGLLQFI